MKIMFDFFNNSDPKVIAAIVAAVTSVFTVIVSLLVKPFLESSVHKGKAQIDHEYEQKKKIKDALAVYKIRIVQSSESLKNRISNLIQQANIDWIKVDGKYDNPDNYYFHSTVYRVLNLLSLIHLLDRNLIYLDTSIASGDDLVFIKYLNAIKIAFQKFNLFDGISGDITFQELEKDVIYRNNLEELSEILINNEGEIISFSEYKNALDRAELNEIFEFIDGINPTEARLRYDRIMVVYMVLVAFIDKYGYDFQKYDKSRIDKAIKIVPKREIFGNFKRFIKRYKLSQDSSMKKVLKRL